MPYPHQHAARQVDPEKFTGEFRTIDIEPGITAVVGTLTGEDSSFIQSYRFDADKFTEEQAREWLEKSGATCEYFEAAVKEEESFDDYPKAASDNARKAIEWRENYGTDAGTPVGWARASQLANREKISLDTVKRMAAFNRHRDNSKIAAEYKGEPWKDKGYLMWLAWGGDEGIDWAIRKSGATVKESYKHITEASLKDAEGKLWEIVIIREGVSLNGFSYSADVLKESIPQFEGVGVFAHQFGHIPGDITAGHRPDELSDPGRLALNKVGWIDGIEYVEGVGLRGQFHCTHDTLQKTLLNTWTENPAKMLGFSIDVLTSAHPAGNVVHIDEIRKAHSVDIVTHPSAGGEFQRLVAGNFANAKNQNIKESQMDFLKKVLDLVKSGAISLDGYTADMADDAAMELLKKALGVSEEYKQMTEEVVEAVTKLGSIEAMKEKIMSIEKQAAPAIDNSKVEKVEQEMKALESRLIVKEALLSDKTLDSFQKEKIEKSFTGRVVDRAEVDAAIKAEKEYLDRVLESGSVKASGYIKVTQTPSDRLQAAMDVLVDPTLAKTEEYKSVPRFYGIREAFERFHNCRVEEAVRKNWRVSEATQATFPTACGDSMSKYLIKMYDQFKSREPWTKFVSENDTSNLQKQELVRIGGFEDMDTVAEDGAYTEFTGPSEENPEASFVKKGNYYTITEEMIINDSTRVLQQIPVGIAQSGVGTLSKFVYNLVTGCDGSNTENSQTIYTGGVLYTGAQGNLGAAVLSYDALDAGVAAMSNFTQQGSSRPIGLNPKYLIVPPELWRTAWNVCKNELVQANANGGSIQNAIAGYEIEPLKVPRGYLCASTVGWYLIADPAQIEGINIFYYAGKREPEILIQDQPTNGAVFTNDRMTFRGKFRFAGCISDWRAFYAYPV